MNELIAAGIAALVELVLHWFPWRLIFTSDPPRVIAYIGGVLGFTLPLSWLLWSWGDLRALAALWVVICAAGSAVCLAYALDGLLIRLAQRREYRQLLERHEARPTDEPGG